MSAVGQPIDPDLTPKELTEAARLRFTVAKLAGGWFTTSYDCDELHDFGSRSDAEIYVNDWAARMGEFAASEMAALKSDRDGERRLADYRGRKIVRLVRIIDKLLAAGGK